MCGRFAITLSVEGVLALNRVGPAVNATRAAGTGLIEPAAG
ncbi:hypothetical protein [Rhodovulum strictum]|nr:hypothetical protein [Rhodovulum strictum]